MKYLKTTEQYENCILLENADAALFEPPKLTGYKSIQTKVFKDIKLDFYFVSTFGTSIPLLYPVVEKLLNNAEFSMPLSKVNIVLMTIFALAVLFRENKEQIDKLKTVLHEKGIFKLAEMVLESLKSIKLVFVEISKKFGKVIRNMSEMFSYVALLVPFMNCLMEYANTTEISVKTLTTMAAGVVVASITRALVYVSDQLYDKLKLKLKSNKTYIYDPETEQGIISLIDRTFNRVKQHIEKNKNYEMIDKAGDTIYYEDIVISKYKSYPLQQDFHYSIVIYGEKFDTLTTEGIVDSIRKFYDYMLAKAKLAHPIGQGHRQRH